MPVYIGFESISQSLHQAIGSPTQRNHKRRASPGRAIKAGTNRLRQTPRRLSKKTLNNRPKNLKGKGTYTDESTNRWDAIAAEQVDGGFKVLLEGTNNALHDQYLAWTTDFNGTIINSTGFQPGDTLADQGLETLFAVDLNVDGFI